MNTPQTSNTNGAMGKLGAITREPYDAQSYTDLVEARFGFLGGEKEPYNVWYEPNLPWPQEVDYQEWQAALRNALITNAGSLLSPTRR